METKQWRNVSVLFATVLGASLAVAVAGLLPAFWVLGLGGVLFTALLVQNRESGSLAQPVRPSVQAEELEAIELSAAYADVLRAHEGLRGAMRDGDNPSQDLRDVYQRCTDLVLATGKVARSGDSLRRYMGARSPLTVEAEVARLEDRAARSCDDGAASAYRMAAGARRRQLDTYQQIGTLYDRIEARLVLVTSFLSAVEAMVVKLQALDMERLHDELVSIGEQIDELNGEIGMLETNLGRGRLVAVPDHRSLAAGA
jgi:hypothetical protein